MRADIGAAVPLKQPSPADRGVAPDTARPFDHRVQFYDSDAFLFRVLREFFAGGQRMGEPLAAFMTDVHRRGFIHFLVTAGVDVEHVQSAGQLLLIDARETLAALLADGVPDASFFAASVGGVFSRLLPASRTGRVRMFGEMVDLLWMDRNPRAMIALEALWNDLGQRAPITLLCAYSMANFPDRADRESFERVCDAHASVAPAEDYPTGRDTSERLREVTLLQQRARALEGEIRHRERLEEALREALGERRRVEDALRISRHELLDFFENAADGFHWVGSDGVILSANRAELALLGYTENEYVGHNIAEFHVDPDVIVDLLARLCRGEVVKDCEARLRCKGGTIKHVLIHANVYFRDGEFIHTRCSTRDISDRKRLEDELRRQNDELLRAVRFSEMFVGILGHDLRNPLSAIATAASLLRKRAESDKVAKPAARILSSAGRMAHMIDQLLDFTRIRLGKGIPVEPRAIVLADVCRRAVEGLEGTGAAGAIELAVAGDTAGSWDADRLSQLVSNLIGNALAHGDIGGGVSLRVDGTRTGVVVIEVRNAGVVSPEVLPVLFEPFRSTANKKHARSNGLGLGLFISRQIVLAHAGAIEVTSSEADGTRLIVTLPRQPVAEPEPGADAAGAR